MKKLCTGCGIEKDLDEFHNSSRTPTGRRSKCKSCVSEYDKKPERVAKRRESTKKWTENNKTHVREKLYEWRRDNPGECARHMREWRKRNPEKAIRMVREYQLANPDKVVQFAQNIRARRLNVIGTFTSDEWVALKIKSNFTCPCCNKKEPDIKLSPDHIIPLSRGGTNFIDNIQPLCLHCNNKKHLRTTDYRKNFKCAVMGKEG